VPAADTCTVKIMLDLQNNGWFAGDDNYRIEVAADTVTKVQRMRAASATEWPTEDDSAVDPASVPFEVVGPLLHHTHSVMLTLKREQFPELVTKPGTVIAINIGIRKDGEAWYYMLADPNSLMPLELK
jgi:hypothetical protein